jgi:hypothetical protein
LIRPLRRRHPWMVGAVAAIVAPLYLAALATRPQPVIQQGLPVGLSEPAAAVSGAGLELPTTPPIRVRPAAAGTIEVAAEGFVEGADLLLYWMSPEDGRSLSEAYLLGALRGGERQLFALPGEQIGAVGFLVLYSLGHGEEIARAPWPPEPGGAP